MNMRWLKRPWITLLGGFTLALVGLQCFAVYMQPVTRHPIADPIYVVADSNAAETLSSGRPVVCWGRLPLGIYNGRRAFSSSPEALDYLQRRGLLSRGYAVYQVSGDFAQDTHQVGERHFTDRTMRITSLVAPRAAQYVKLRR